MAELEPSPSPFNSFPQIDSSHHSPFIDFPDVPQDLPSLDDIDFDFDFDLDFPIDGLDFPVEQSHPSPSDASPPLNSNLSSLSSSSPAASGNQPPDRSPIAAPTSPDSATSETGNPNPTASVQDDAARMEEDRGRGTGLKRKICNSEVIPNPNPNPSPNSSQASKGGKIRRPEEADSSWAFSPGNEDDEKRKARLIRNRESAQLSRQRKKHYVEELEEKVRCMESTIADLSARMSYFTAENASLRQQLGAGARASNQPPRGAYPPPPPGPVAPVHFPWIPAYAYAPPGSRVPIPRLKSQPPQPAPKKRKSESKKAESKKAESKTKKVASISLLGFLFVMLIFGGLIPAVNIIYGGSDNGVAKGGILDHSHGRVLTVSGRSKSCNSTNEIGVCSGKDGIGEHIPACTRNSSDTLPALLYVPRNGKHVMINGNLIIHSVLASEKAMAEQISASEATQSAKREMKETGLAIKGNMVPQAGKEVDRHSKTYMSSIEHHIDAFGESSKSSLVDGLHQQWFHEGLTGSFLSSGMCTEVFQFDASPSSNPGGIIPASVVNATEKLAAESAYQGNTRNRRILYSQPIPLPGSTLNNTDNTGKHSGDLHGNATVPSMVVSVLADPRESGDGDGDGVMPPKSLSRIFVVVLLDSVKYVTYSCALPFKSSSPTL